MTARFLLLAATAVTALGVQNAPITRQVDLTLTEGTSMAAAVSPDRRSIAIDLLGSLWVLPVRGGEAKKITPDLLEARQPTWSPDSQSIAFQGFDDGTWHIYAIDREGGEPKALTAGVFDDREPAWSHDGSRIAFSSDRYGGITTIWELNVENGDLRQVTQSDGWMPAWAPNDREITFSSANTTRRGSPVLDRDRVPGLYAVDADGRERLVLDATRDGIPIAAAWSPSGIEVAYSIEGGHLGVNGRAASGGDEDVFPFRPQWISQNEILYTADGHIKRRSLAGPVAVIPFTATVSLQRDTFTIAHRDLAPTEPQRVVGIVNPAVSPDGRSVAFTALGDLWLLPVGGAPIQITDDEAVEMDPAWSPDGAQLAFSSDRGGHMNLWIHDLRTDQDAQVTYERGAVSGAAWSPDGTHIAYLVDRIGMRAVQVRPGGVGGGFTASTGPELGRPTWSPDSKAVAMGSLLPYSDRYGDGLTQALLYNFEFHSRASSLLFPWHSAGNRQDTGPVWAPDGTQMAFVTEGRLWTVNVNDNGGATGPPTPITAIGDDQPESPSWEGDSRHLVYQTPAGLRRILADGSPPDPIALDLSWTPSPTPERTVVHAGHVFDGTLNGLRGESDIVIEDGVIRSIEGHSDDLHVGAVVDASNEIVMPGLIEMHAHLDPGYGADFGRVLAGVRHHGRADSIDQSVCRHRAARVFRRGPSPRSTRVPGGRSVRRRAACTTRAAWRSPRTRSSIGNWIGPRSWASIS